MSFSNVQFLAIINGVRSICDELLKIDPVAEIPPLPGVVIPMPPALRLVGDPATPPTGAAPGTPPPVEGPPSSPPTGPPPVELDAEGLPWDARIHTVKKSQLKSGVWRIAPKTDPVLVAKVKTELTLAAQAAPGTAAPSADPGAGGGTGNPPPGPGLGEDQSAGNPPPDPGATMSWSDLLNKIVAAGKTPEEVLTACTTCGVENIGTLQDAPAMIPNVAVVLGI